MRFENRDGPRREGGFQREMHEITCADCGQKATVPFKPHPNNKFEFLSKKLRKISFLFFYFFLLANLMFFE